MNLLQDEPETDSGQTEEAYAEEVSVFLGRLDGCLTVMAWGVLGWVLLFIIGHALYAYYTGSLAH